MDWQKVRRIARLIADLDYSLQQFNKDLGVFPELDLYLLDGDLAPLGAASNRLTDTTASGRSIGDEFQRSCDCARMAERASHVA